MGTRDDAHAYTCFGGGTKDVVNEVWRVVNAAYVDPTFNGQDWKAARLKVG